MDEIDAELVKLDDQVSSCEDALLESLDHSKLDDNGWRRKSEEISSYRIVESSATRCERLPHGVGRMHLRRMRPQLNIPPYTA